MAPGVEITDINWLALVLGIVVNMVLGFLWYAPKTPTGKIWMRDNKFDPVTKPTRKQMMTGIALMVVGAFFLMFVFQHTFLAYRDAYDLDDAGAGYDLSIVDGLVGGAMTWLGFFVPVYLGVVAWENKPWSLFFVNAGYYLVALLIVGTIYAAMI